jgi:hypothetical protein
VTPAELKVIEAAREHLEDCESGYARLLDAVDALEAERKAGLEQTIPWGQVVESDQIWSDKTCRWYEVISAVALEDGHSRIQAKGLPKSITPLSDKTVLVRRGATGQVVDRWNVLWSAQTVPNTPEVVESEES